MFEEGILIKEKKSSEFCCYLTLGYFFFFFKKDLLGYLKGREEEGEIDRVGVGQTN